MSSSDVIEWISARGKPLVVATDVYPTPGAVEKVKRAFNAVLFSPGADVPAEEKIALGKEFGYKNDHERDSLAAAASAFKKYKNKFTQVERKVPSEIDPDEVKALVVRGYSIENAIAEFAPPMASETPAQSRQSLSGSQQARPSSSEDTSADASLETAILRQQNQQLTEQVRTLRSYVDELKAALTEKDVALRSVKGKLERSKDKAAREVKRQHEIKIRDKEIARLRSVLRSERKHIKKLKKALERQKKMEVIEETRGLLKLRPLSTFAREAVLLASRQYGIEKGDLIYLEDASGGGRSTVELLQELGIRGVVTADELPAALRDHFFDLGVPVLSNKTLSVKMINNLPFVRPEDLSAAMLAWEKEVEDRRAKKKMERLEGIFQEYRVERIKEEKRKQKLSREKKVATE
jgi:predicted RNase H-like nuclease (RuvC/YqgF family)